MRFKTHLKIHLPRLAHNVEKLKAWAPRNEILFMIKADAYGHGMVPVVRFCAGELGLTEFGCASIGEALKLRLELAQNEFEIYVFSDLELDLPQCREAYGNKRILPVISCLEDLRLFFSDPMFASVPLCLKLNSGMNRLGFAENEIPELLSEMKRAGRRSIYHLMTHLASSSRAMKAADQNHQQAKKFEEMKGHFVAAGISIERTSMSNSGGILQNFGMEYSHIRPGLMLYGPSSLDPQDRGLSSWSGKTISDLDSYLIAAYPVAAGALIGYGGVAAPTAGVLAIIPMGYGDGLSTHYKNLQLTMGKYQGRSCGRINMDMTAFLFPAEAKDKIKVGDPCRLWGENPSEILQLADNNHTIPYEIFCQVSSRIPRLYSLN